METTQAQRQEGKQGGTERGSIPDEEHSRDAWWSMLGTFYRRRWFIVAVTGFVAVASIGISLLLPVWYQSTARVIIPSGGEGGGISALLGDLDPAAAALLGTSGGDYIRYMAILTSRTLTDRVIDEFDLMDVYETRDSKTPWRDARKELDDNTAFEIDRDFDFLGINVFDQDRERAASMANFFVEELNRMNIELSTESASRYRRFVERRYNETVANLDSAMAALQNYQEEYGLLELEQQSEAFLEILAQYRAATFQAEIEYEGLLMDYGKENPMVQSARNRVEAARAKERALLEGRDPLLPVAIDELPQIARGYATAMRDVAIYENIIEFARPLLEQAIFEEQREAPAVQVLDRAVVAEWKAKPKRAFIVVGATLSAFILVLIQLGLVDWLRRKRAYLAERFDSELETGT